MLDVASEQVPRCVEFTLIHDSDAGQDIAVRFLREVGGSSIGDFVFGGALRVSSLEFRGESPRFGHLRSFLAATINFPLLKAFSRAYSIFLFWVKIRGLPYVSGSTMMFMHYFLAEGINVGEPSRRPRVTNDVGSS